MAAWKKKELACSGFVHSKLQAATEELKLLIILYICTCPPQPSSDHKEFFSVPDVTGVATEMTADICWSVSQRCLRSVTPRHRSESDPDAKKPNKETAWDRNVNFCYLNKPKPQQCSSCSCSYQRGEGDPLTRWKLSLNRPTELWYAGLPYIASVYWF